MRLSLIAAVAENGVIGRRGDLPWHLSADLRRFKRLTLGHHLLMGRKTFESIGRPLPGRTTVVISRQAGYAPAGVRVAGSLDEALAIARAAGDAEAFVAGGGEIYRLALQRCDRLYLTRIHGAVEGDTFFPPFDPAAWHRVAVEEHPPEGDLPYRFSFEIYERAPVVEEPAG